MNRKMIEGLLESIFEKVIRQKTNVIVHSPISSKI